MLICTFEHGAKANLRHVVTHAIVEKDGKLLLEKRDRSLSEGGKWALPGGFLERGENLEKGVLRELVEETGWKGEVVSLFRINSSPTRPREDRQNVALEFIIKPLKKTKKITHEVMKVEWIPIDKVLPFAEFAFDHGETIKLYLEYRKKSFKIPIIK